MSLRRSIEPLVSVHFEVVEGHPKCQKASFISQRHPPARCSTRSRSRSRAPRNTHVFEGGGNRGVVVGDGESSVCIPSGHLGPRERLSTLYK